MPRRAERGARRADPGRGPHASAGAGASPAASPPPSLSLTARMVTGLVGLLLVGGVVLSLAAFAYGRAAARDAFDRLLVGAAASIAASVSIRDGAPVVDLPVSAFQLLALAPDDRVAYRVSGPGGTLTGYDDLPGPPEGAGGGDRVLYDARFTGEPARYIRVSRRFAERSFSGRVDVIVGQTLRARTELARDIARKALVGLAVGGLALLLLVALIVRHALRPLDLLAERLAARDPQDLTPLDGRVPREIAPMVGALNGFMGRLDRQFGTMRRLIGDTAHQLRNPVAALRAQADLALHEEDPERRALLVGRIHARTRSLGRLLDQMLSRALVVHRADTVRRSRLDLRDIALEVVEAGDHALLAPGVTVELEIGEDPVPVTGDALSLTEAVKNLLSNAVIHGTAPVVVGVEARGGEARIWVEDAGGGPSPALRARLGERFVTGAGRARGGPVAAGTPGAPGEAAEATGARGAQSSGLGLAIAHSVAEAFGGRLEMSGGTGRASGPEGGPAPFRMTLVFEVPE